MAKSRPGKGISEARAAAKKAGGQLTDKKIRALHKKGGGSGTLRTIAEVSRYIDKHVKVNGKSTINEQWVSAVKKAKQWDNVSQKDEDRYISESRVRNSKAGKIAHGITKPGKPQKPRVR